MLVAEKISKKYGDLQVLEDLSLTVHEGEIVALTGASGAGKSTLLHILSTLEKPDSGVLRLGDEDLLSMRGSRLSTFRNRSIGFVFQLYNLLPDFTVLENICMPGYIRGDQSRSVEKRAQALIKMLGLSARASYKPGVLSGGEQQRTAVARALINEPRVVFADEPSGNLDKENAARLHELFFELRDRLGQTFVIATHDLALAKMADRKFSVQKVCYDF